MNGKLAIHAQTMPPIEFAVALLVVTIPLVTIARRFDIPYPVVLIIGGLLLGFVPRLPRVELNPDLVLVIFLPPLMYWQSITAPTDEMRANAAWIWPMAVGLVIATIIGVAIIGHAIVPGMEWAVAFVLGAIVAPTDEIAVAPTLERFRVPRRVIAIIEGESLLNDAGSLVIYAAAIRATVTDVFSWPSAVLHFLFAGVGAMGIGLIAGWLAVEAWRRVEDPQLALVISVVLPFVAYVPAQRLALSGVVAVVAAGVYANRFTPTVITPATRLQATGFWETIVFLANVVIFILVGWQLHAILGALSRYSSITLISYALIVNAAVIAIRFAWVFGQGYVSLFNPGGRRRITNQWAHLLMMAWSGPRGGVSLAAALAIPAVLAGGQPFPERDLLIFLTFSVILVTLVGAALTLPAVIARLKVEDDDVSRAEERKAVGAMAAAALARLDELEGRGQLESRIAEVLRRRYERRMAQFGRNRGTVEADREDKMAQQLARAEQEILDAQRAALIDLRNRGEIDNVVLRHLQLLLDMQQAQLDERAHI
jgi:monovalent cation/hydrogen antiporter